MGLHRRLKRLEASSSRRRGFAWWRTPEQEAERERRFDALYHELGIVRSTEHRDPEEAMEKLFAEMARQREEIDRKETS